MLQSSIQDPHSFSNPQEASIKHIELDLTPDFSTKQFEGIARLHVEKQDSAQRIILDVDELDISSILIEGEPVAYELGKKEDFIGQELIIPLEGSSNSFTITIKYKTSPEAKGLIWRTPEQTDGKTHPLVYSHSQPTYASSIYPAQHSPMQRYTYGVTLRTPQELMGLMSSQDNPKELDPSGIYRFNITKAIPSYLCAFAVGDFRYKQIGADGRTGIYAEPVNLERAYEEFLGTGNVLELAETRFGKYIWNVYNILVLPVDYPAGAMEHPWLSYFSNEFITGKKDRVRVVYHELSHSWFGNLVTAGLWGDLWLNEGLTTYGECALAELIDPELAEILSAVYYEKLTDAAKTLSPELTCLKVDFSKPDATGKVKNPRDNFSFIPYYKGFLFFKLLEKSLGLENFTHFIKDYLEAHAFKSVTTEIFEAFFEQWLREHPECSAPDNLKEWLYEPGLPANAPKFTSARIDSVNTVVKEFMSQGIDAVSAVYDSLINIELEYLIVKLSKENLTHNQMTSLNLAFRLNKHPALNVREAWLLCCARKGYTPAYPAISEYVLYRKKPKLVANVFDILVKSTEGRRCALHLYQDCKTKLEARGKKAAFDILVKAGLDPEKHLPRMRDLSVASSAKLWDYLSFIELDSTRGEAFLNRDLDSPVDFQTTTTILSQFSYAPSFIQHAAMIGDLDLVKDLCLCGVDVNFEGDKASMLPAWQQPSALQIACNNGYSEMVDVLLKHNAKPDGIKLSAGNPLTFIWGIKEWGYGRTVDYGKVSSLMRKKSQRMLWP